MRRPAIAGSKVRIGPILRFEAGRAWREQRPAYPRTGVRQTLAANARPKSQGHVLIERCGRMGVAAELSSTAVSGIRAVPIQQRDPRSYQATPGTLRCGRAGALAKRANTIGCGTISRGHPPAASNLRTIAKSATNSDAPFVCAR